ncbi:MULTISPECIES: 5-oxoprolinase subunit PxpA [unclassified Polynucleobacter]|jgi:5-oxoprolinase (ATP-hydrolysing) subunit A|uniref:5-oxoprolinase subunit PxpA n=1 Tax=unclassified Polynucleobacter TaxID=2640945 RepID=UPI001BFCE130|nr:MULTISPECIES: 5-oxoprolinase subunit PxpA [unclassified Polynucleobacter]MEA9601344.1 5-oxoprolinase subunit PxpA [Polynucleobacter sp. MG-28-Ekke-A2]QWD82064.1 LamB/YcsF family protein [Polynucleobacter sp. MWH-S4W17]
MDINSDMGEGFGAWEMGNDALLLDYITSTNIACGWHAGDPARMKKLVEMASKKGVHIGAHPGLPDLEGFGRREMAVSEEDAYNYVLYQAGALKAFVNAIGKKLHHVKPHGALYNQAAKDIKLARGIAQAVKDLGSEVILYGLAGSCLIDAAKELNVPAWQEVFADRKYTKEGFLVPRTQAGAVIEDETEALNQVISMSKNGKVIAIDGNEIEIQTDTLCIHGDNPHAVEFAKRIKAALS